MANKDHHLDLMMQTVVLLPFPFYLVRLLSYRKCSLLHGYKDWGNYPDTSRISLRNFFVVLHLRFPSVNLVPIHKPLTKCFVSSRICFDTSPVHSQDPS